MNYYNEFDPKAAAWLRELIKAGLIPPGDVDERSIKDVRATDLLGYCQCHFFAGIGGWPLALALAGWPEEEPVWTGSCPCQPYSGAGKGLGNADPRHLWPDFFNLIRQSRPVVVFGEQVASAIRHGWLDGVSADLEGENYACGAVVFGAHSVGAPHIRQRLYWVAHTNERGCGTGRGTVRPAPAEREGGNGITQQRSGVDRLADSTSARRDGPQREPKGEARYEARMQLLSADSTPDRLEHAARDGWQQWRTEPSGRGVAGGRGLGGMVLPDSGRRETGEPAATSTGYRRSAESAGHWDGCIAVPCRDGKSRRVKPGIQPLAHGIPERVGVLRGAGNAIVPQGAAEFIGAYLDIEQEAAR